jgi:hypothetical protein
MRGSDALDEIQIFAKRFGQIWGGNRGASKAMARMLDSHCTFGSHVFGLDCQYSKGGRQVLSLLGVPGSSD